MIKLNNFILEFTPNFLPSCPLSNQKARVRARDKGYGELKVVAGYLSTGEDDVAFAFFGDLFDECAYLVGFVFDDVIPD